jgi:hypothetical protein
LKKKNKKKPLSIKKGRTRYSGFLKPCLWPYCNPQSIIDHLLLVMDSSLSIRELWVSVEYSPTPPNPMILDSKCAHVGENMCSGNVLEVDSY